MVLAACRRDGAWSDGRLKAEIRENGLSRADAALCTHICYGVMQNMSLLDFYLAHYCTMSLKKLEPQVLDILRAGAYQIIYLDKIPDSAAVNEAVKAAKRLKNPRAAGLVNGVLRTISREKERLPALNCATKQEYLALKYSHPLWLVRRLYDIYGRQDCEKLLAADNEPAPTTVQVNTLRCGEEEAVRSLEEQGVAVEKHPFLPGCLILKNTGDMEKLGAFAQGLIQPQDAAARLAVLAADPKPGMRIVDGCSAPGGKSFASAMLMEDRGDIRAFDIHEHKIALIEKGARRLGITIIRGEQNDARNVKNELRDWADIVIADVPCSGMGTIRKKPDVRFKKEQDVDAMPPLQLQILTALSKYAKPGGTVLYSTCTILPEENEKVVEKFLEENSNFSLESFTLPGVGETAGYVTLLPHIHGTDGFFICRLRRNT